MSPQRAKTFVRLFAALSLSIAANLFFLQPRLAGRLHGGEAAAQPQPQAADAKTRLAAVTPKIAPAEPTAENVRAIQRALKDVGHYPGPLDGRLSLLTHAAIFAYEQHNGMAMTAEPSAHLLAGLVSGRAEVGPPPKGGPDVTTGSQAEKVVVEIRRLLTALGYATTGRDSKVSAELTRVIRQYETDNTMLPPTGRITAPLMQHMQRKAASIKPPTG